MPGAVPSIDLIGAFLPPVRARWNLFWMISRLIFRTARPCARWPGPLLSYGSSKLHYQLSEFSHGVSGGGRLVLISSHNSAAPHYYYTPDTLTTPFGNLSKTTFPGNLFLKGLKMMFFAFNKVKNGPGPGPSRSATRRWSSLYFHGDQVYFPLHYHPLYQLCYPPLPFWTEICVSPIVCH